jgi:hypothetical protein
VSSASCSLSVLSALISSWIGLSLSIDVFQFLSKQCYKTCLYHRTVEP